MQYTMLSTCLHCCLCRARLYYQYMMMQFNCSTSALTAVLTLPACLSQFPKDTAVPVQRYSVEALSC